jgi:hypothetical protein
MTLGTMTTFVERLARLTGAVTIATASDATKTYINEGVREFSKRTHGIDTEAFLSLSPKFDADTNFAAKFTIGGNTLNFGSTDLPLVSSTLRDVTPTTLMSHITSNVNAVGTGSFTISMGWSASNWMFYINAPATCTNFIISSPTYVGYVDASPLFFGGSISRQGSVTITCAFPQDCNVDTSLPSGFLEMKNVFWGTNELREAPFSNFLRPRAIGTPQYYAVNNKEIFLNPVPNKQDYFKIFYSAFPTDLGVDGSSDSTSCPLPEEMHMAPVYWAAACLLDESHEFDKSTYYQRKFNDMCTDYKIREANNNPSMFPNTTYNPPPNVVMSSI